MTEELQQRFQFVRRLGSGVLGEVHEVIDESRGESVVLKIFVRSRPARPDHFRMEFESIARLDHDNLARMHHLVDPASDTNVVLEERFGVPGLAFTQELVDGVDLLTFLRSSATAEETRQLSEQRNAMTVELVPDSSDLDPTSSDLFDINTQDVELDPHLDEAGSIVSELARPTESAPLDIVLLRLQHILPQVVSALEYLHRFHRVHGNIRPSNIMVTPGGDVKITDYGIVPELVFYRPGEAEMSLLHAPENLPYLAPEVENVATVASDLYALGCVLFEAIAGESPFEALEFDHSTGEAKLRPPPLADHVPECPQSWGEIVDGLLNEDPEQRPSLVEVLDRSTRHVAQTVVVTPRRVKPVRGFEGRREILRSLIHEARRATDDTRLQLSVVKGQTGVGKSSVVTQLGHFLSRRGWLVLNSPCFHREVVPHQSWIPIAEQIAKVCDELPPIYAEQTTTARARASRMLSALAGPDSGAEMSRRDALRSFHDLLAFLSQQRPLLIILDDVENASWDSEALLVQLLSDVRPLRGMCVTTWTSDSPRAKSPRLFDDLDRTLIDYKSFDLGPLDPTEAPELAAVTPFESVAHQMVYPLITKWWNAYPGPVDRALEHSDPNDVHGWFVAATEQIFDELKPVEQITLTFVALSSTAVPRDSLTHAVCEFDSKFRDEQTHQAIETLLAIGFVGEDDEQSLFLPHDAVRIGVENATDETTATGVYNKLAAQFREVDEAAAFEYAHRAGHITTAVEAAQKQAIDARNFFASHRAAKIWRWLEENRERLPGGSRVDPLPRLAEVEFEAGEFETAASLFGRWAEQEKEGEKKAEIYLRQAESELRALNFAQTRTALERALVQLRSFYEPSKTQIAQDGWDRATAQWGILTSPALGPLPSDRIKLIQRAHRAAASWDRYISGTGSRGAVARLVRQARKRKGATSWGVAILEYARMIARERPTSSGERLLDLASEAVEALSRSEDRSLQRSAELLFERVKTQFEVRSIFEIQELVAGLVPHVGFAEVRASLDLAETSLQFGAIEQASRFALETIRSNRRDALLSAKAYGVLADAALLHGDIEGCELFVGRSAVAIDYERPTPFAIEWLLRTSLHSIARGEPEVGVAQCSLLMENKSFRTLSPALSTRVWLTLQHCVNAQLNRQQRIQSGRLADSMVLLKRGNKALRGVENDATPLVAAEVYRCNALYALRQKKFGKAEKELKKAGEIIGGKFAMVSISKTAEAVAIVKEAVNDADAAGMFERVSLLNHYLEVSRPLGLEGWPLSQLSKED